MSLRVHRLVVFPLFGALASVAACSSGDGNSSNDVGDSGTSADGSVDASTDASHPPDGGPDADASTCPKASGVDVSAAVAKADRDLAHAVCARLDACCSASDRDGFFGQFKDKPYNLQSTPTSAECESALGAQLAIVHGKWSASTQRGNMAFDKCAVDACVAKITSATCGVKLSEALFDASCFGLRGNAIFTKTAPVGARCQDIGDGTFNGECDPATGYCGSAQKCEAWKKTGEICQVSPTRAFCAPDLSCDGATPSMPGKCSAPSVMVALGAHCDAATGAIQVCPATAYCDFGGSGTCVAKKADGAACATDDECATSHPYSCYPYGAGHCGSSAYCAAPGDGGTPDGGADASDASDASASDAQDGGDASTDAGTMHLTIERTDDATPSRGVTADAAQRDRVTLRWSVPGATSVAIDGAGALLAVVRDGVPTYDDMTSATGLQVTSPTQSSSIWGFRQVIAATLPFSTTILGDTWSGRLSINPHGIVTRGLASSPNELNYALPLPYNGVSTSDWAQGTLAPYFDRRLDSNATGTSRIRTGSFGAGNDRRFVVEWAGMTTSSSSTRKIPGTIDLQMAVYADGRVEYRYKTLAIDSNDSQPNIDLALVQGQAASIGVAQSYDNTMTPAAVPLSIHRASLPTAGVTYTFTPSGALPSEGRAIVVLPAAAGSASFTLHATGIPDETVSATIAPMYTQTTDTRSIRDIAGVAGAQVVPFGTETVLPIDLPFAIDAFHEGWKTLAVTRSGAVGPWGVQGLDLGLNYRSIPSPFYPNGFIGALYTTTGSPWCAGSGVPQMTYVVEGSAPQRAVTILMRGLNKCGSSAGAIDLEIVLRESGDVELFYDNLTSTADEITGKGVLVGMENGNGDVASLFENDTAGRIASGTHVTFARHR